MSYLRLVISLLLLLSVSSAYCQFVLDPEAEYSEFDSHLSTYEDATGQLAIDAIVDGSLAWEPLQKAPNFGYSASVHWLRTDIFISPTNVQDRVLEIDYPMLDRVDLYLLENGSITKRIKTGDTLPFASRQYLHRNYLLRFTVKPGSTYQLVIAVSGQGSLTIPLRLWRAQDFNTQDQRRQVLHGIFVGGLVIMILYNLIIALVIRMPNYLYYVAYIVSTLMVLSSIYGLSFQYLWPNSPAWSNTNMCVFLGTLIYFALQFVIRFLNLQQMPRSYLYMRLLSMLGLLSALGSFVFPYSVIIKVEVIAGIAACISAFSYSGIMVARGDRSARVFALAWGTFLLGGFLFFLRNLGLIPSASFIHYSIEIASLIEVSLLSLALANRINDDRAKIFKAEKAMLEAEHRAVVADAESKAKSEFLARMSHEIRTPMNGILGMSQLLQERLSDPTSRYYNEVVYSSGNSLLSLINDILDLSKIEAGKIELEAIPFHIDKLVLDIFSIFRIKAEQKGVELISNILPEVPKVVVGDPTRLGQVLINLVGNAMKFTEEGSVTLRVSLAGQKAVNGADNRIQSETANYQFEVIDTGIGVAEVDQAGLFSAFHQAGADVARKYGGTGLGLNICKQLVELMGGSIWMHSELGNGSVFGFDIALQVSDRQCGESRRLRTVMAGQYILVWIANDLYGETVMRFLRNSGLNAVRISSRQLLVDVIPQERNFNVLLTDQVLDQETIDQVLERVTPIRGKPILLLSSLTDSLPEPMLESVVAVEKPLTETRLVEVLLQEYGTGSSEDQCIHLSSPVIHERKTILVAEDNKVNQMVAKGMLSSLGYDVVMVEDGEQAVAAIKNRLYHIDAVLMDCDMPNLDGFVATEIIRKWEATEELEPVPIIALTAHASADILQRCLACGMNNQLSKPVLVEELSKLLLGIFNFTG